MTKTVHTTNCFDTFIQVAEIAPRASARSRRPARGNPTVAGLHYKMITEAPYKYTSDDVVFATLRPGRQLDAKATKEGARPCPRRILLQGAGVSGGHQAWQALRLGRASDADGRVAIYAVDSKRYQDACAGSRYQAGAGDADQASLSFPLGISAGAFPQSLDAFLDLGAAHALAVAEVGGFLVELAAGEFVDGALHAAHRQRRVAGQECGEPVDFLVRAIPRAPWR
jgi:hypothetical protein